MDPCMDPRRPGPLGGLGPCTHGIVMGRGELGFSLLLSHHCDLCREEFGRVPPVTLTSHRRKYRGSVSAGLWDLGGELPGALARIPACPVTVLDEK